jgi:putative nucleotidyltransferase with HDIG domain
MTENVKNNAIIDNQNLFLVRPMGGGQGEKVAQNQSSEVKETGYFFPVPPLMLFPRTRGDFAVYLKQDGLYVLYTKAKDIFTEQTRQRLFESGVDQVYVLQENKEEYQQYVEKNLGKILGDSNVPDKERARVFYDASLSVVKEAMETRLPGQAGQQLYDRLQSLVTEGVKYLHSTKALKNLAGLISHDYQTYSHSLQVFVYTMSVLHTFGVEQKDMVPVGIGCLLHDIGKSSIPLSILNKPGKLNPKERELIETHPLTGVAQLAHLPLGQEVVNCVLFHHERTDGSGYPAGLKGDQLVMPVKVLAVADVYDALTSHRPYAEAMSPFQALQTMREDMADKFDMEMYRRLVLVLSGADII